VAHSKVPLNEDTIKAVARLIHERDGFVQWVTAAKSLFKDMEAGWFVNDLTGKCKNLKAVFAALTTRVNQDWNSDIRKVSDELASVTPPKLAIYDGRMLIDGTLRQAFRKSVSVLFNSKILGAATDKLQLA